MEFVKGVVSILCIQAVICWWLVRTFKRKGAGSLNELISNAFSALRTGTDHDTFVVSDNGKVASIKFTHNGQSYRLFVPHDDDNLVVAQNTKIYIDTDADRIELADHHPCIPILVTAHHLGATKVIVENQIEDIATIFTGSQQIKI